MGITLGPLSIGRKTPPGQDQSGYNPNRPYGEASKPLSKAETYSTFGAVGTVFFAGIPAQEEYVPELDGERAVWTYDRMWKSDGQIAATVNVCLLPLLQATYSFQPADGDDDEEEAQNVTIAQFVTDNLLYGMQITWHDFLRQLFLGRFLFGHSVFEKCWTIDDDGMTRLRKLAPRLQKTLYRWFPNDDDELDRIMQRVWVQDENGITGKYEYPTIPAQKLLVSTRNRLGNNFLGISLLRHAYLHWYYKQALYKIDGIACERNGLGVPVVNEPEGVVVQKADRDAAAQMAMAFHAHEKMYVELPSGWKFSLAGVSGSVRDVQPSIQHHDLLIARSILAQFINVDSGGTLIAARDASSFFLQALEAELRDIADDLNAVIRELVNYNWPGITRYPTLQVKDLDQRDVESYLRGLAALFSAKALTLNAETENAIREQIDLPDLPQPATPAGGGVPSVDTKTQGQQAGVDSEAQTEGAAVPDADSGDDALPGELARREAVAEAERIVGRVRLRPPTVLRALTWRRAHPRPKALARAERAAGGEFLSADQQWVYLRKRVGRVPDPNTGDYGDAGAVADALEDARIRGFTHVLWRLGDGGVSGKHCPQCIRMAGKGLLALDELKIVPGNGGTFCTDFCDCTLEFRRARTVKVGA